MQICLLSAGDAKESEGSHSVSDCHLHAHISKSAAKDLIDGGRVRSVTNRAVVAMVPASSITQYWYDKAVQTNDRYLGTCPKR
jgi:hypothetical protein